MNKSRRVGLAGVMLLTLTAMSAGAVFADASVDSPNKVQADTIQLNWTGQGTTSNQLDTVECGSSADFGAGGAQNGATADDYLLWIFTTDGGDVTAAPTITINGTTYANAYQPGNGIYQIVTPGFDPATITDAHTNFVVADTGNGAWVLTISHGCVGTVEDIPYAPAGSLGGPCADPAYYAIFDNSATDPSITTKFRMRWYNNNGLNTAVKLVPGGDIYTTFQHWAKPGTYVSVWYKDKDTGAWVLLERELATRGSYPPCDYQPGWTRASS
jgi:hypothetical protein